MTQDPIFTSAAVGLLRAAAPRRAGRAALPPVPHEAAWLRERLGALAVDEQLLGAVDAAGPSLARDVRAIAGAPAKAKDLRRAVIALTEYHLWLTGFGVDSARERGVYALLHRALAVRAGRARAGR